MGGLNAPWPSLLRQQSRRQHLNTFDRPEPEQSMGQARRRREQLGDQYGTPEGRKRQLEADALRQINRAMAEAVPVLLIGTASTIGGLAKAAGLPWLHELPEGAPCPSAVAFDIDREPRPDFDHFAKGLVVMPDPARLLPEGAREKSLRALAQHLRPEHLQEVRGLLACGAMDWERCYPAAARFAEVRVGCYGGLLRAALKPMEAAHG